MTKRYFTKIESGVVSVATIQARDPITTGIDWSGLPTEKVKSFRADFPVSSLVEKPIKPKIFKELKKDGRIYWFVRHKGDRESTILKLFKGILPPEIRHLAKVDWTYRVCVVSIDAKALVQ